MAPRFLAFPDTVNEYAARVTAGLIVLFTLVTPLTEGPLRLVLLVLLAVGFALRVAGGPRYSPLGRLSVHVLVPLLRRPPLPTAGAPKRFAQGIGLACSTTALLLTVGGWHTAATVVMVILAAAATLESVFGFCLGCWMFRQLIRVGLIPEEACVECANVGDRYATGEAAPAQIDIAQADIGVRVR